MRRVALAPLLLQTIRSPSVSVAKVLVAVKKRAASRRRRDRRDSCRAGC